MGEIVQLKDRRSRVNLADDGAAAEAADPHRQALQKLADKLSAHRFVRESERETVGRNWWEIMRRLKQEHGLKSKGDVYEVLCRRDDDDVRGDPQKRSQQYEVPDWLSGKDLEKRRSKLTQKGERWLRLAERAARISGKERHFWLPHLLKGTAIAPASSEPRPDTPDPVRAVLNLATTACRKIAAALDLEAFFANWSRMWVAYRPLHNDFVPQDDPSRPADESVACAGPAFFLVGEAIKSSLDEQLPFPSAAFAELTRLGPLDAVAYRSVSGKYEELRGVRVRFVRSYRLAIGINDVDRKIAPVIEMRHEVRLTDRDTNADVPFQPGELFDDARGLLESAQWNLEDRERDKDDEPDEHKDGDGDDAEEPIGASLGHGDIMTPDGWVWCSMHCTIPRKEFDDMSETLDRRDQNLKTGNYFDRYYTLLTADTVRDFLSRGYFGNPRNDRVITAPSAIILGSHAFARHPDEMLTLTPYTAMGLKLLEEALLEGTAEHSFYRQLLDDAKAKVESFNRAYQAQLARVRERHDRARAAFEDDKT